MPLIVIDTDTEQPDAPEFTSDTADLVYFLSWAFSARYGGNHEMSVASLVLRGEFATSRSQRTPMPSSAPGRTRHR
jgi:hypothetical protein